MSDTKPPRILETKKFAKWVKKARLRASADQLAVELQSNPTLGDVIPGYSGLRKVRMGGAGRGKQGGFRVVYTLLIDATELVLLHGFSKSSQDDLSADELTSILDLATTAETNFRSAQAAPPTSE